jgi:hypothetical protein
MAHNTFFISFCFSSSKKSKKDVAASTIKTKAAKK